LAKVDLETLSPSLTVQVLRSLIAR